MHAMPTQDFFQFLGRVRSDCGSRLIKVMMVFGSVAALLIGCSGGGGSGPAPASPIPPPVVFDLIYPGETSLTDASQITVVGVTQANQVSSVTIRSGATDVVATLGNDGNWRASAVPLQAGANSLVAEMTAQDGVVNEQIIAVVQSSPILSHPSGVTFDPIGNRVLIVDAKQLLAFDVASGQLEINSSAEVGAGPGFGFARHASMAGDGTVLVLDQDNVLRVDPATGDRSAHVVIPAASFGASSIARDPLLNRLFTVGFVNTLHVADLASTPPILAIPVGTHPPGGLGPGSPNDSTYVPGTDTVYATYIQTLDVVAINGTTGGVETQSVGQGGLLTPTVGIDYDDVQDRVLVLGLSGTVYSIDPNTGNSSVLLAASSAMTPLKPTNGLTHGDGKLWTVSPTLSELISIDLSSGNQTVEADTRVGGGSPPGLMLAGRYDSAGERFVAVSDLRIVAIDPKTGTRELLANLIEPGIFFQPPNFLLVSGMALSQDGMRAWVSDPVTGTLGVVNLTTGELQEISGPGIGSGPLPGQIAGLAVNPAETLAYVGDRFAGRIFRYNLVTGQRVMLPEFAAALGPIEIRSLVLDAVGNRLILNIGPFLPTSTVAPAIYALDLANSDFTLIAGLANVQTPFVGIPSPLFPTTQMSLSEDGSSLFLPVGGNPDVPYARIDLALGTIMPLGDASSGPPFLVPNAIEVAPDGRLFALDATSALFVMDPQTGERVIVSK